jgi:predicted nucleic acid-binding Zn ribbon protein
MTARPAPVTVRGSDVLAECLVCAEPLTHEVQLLGNQYVLPDDPRKRYCSHRCRQRAYLERVRSKDRSQGLPADFTIGARNRARSSRSGRRYMDRHYDAGCYCATCGARMPEQARADARYCSPACRQRAYRERQQVPG